MKTKTVNALIEPASQIVTRRRWQMLGHILRMDDLVPAKQSTINCLKKKNAKRGRLSTSLLTTIKHDLKAHKLNIDQAVELAQDGPMEAGGKPYTGERRSLKIFEHLILSLFLSLRKL